MAMLHPGEMVPSIQVGLRGKICSRNTVQGTGKISCARWKGIDLSRPGDGPPGNCEFSLGCSG